MKGNGVGEKQMGFTSSTEVRFTPLSVKYLLKEDTQGALQGTMNQGGNLRYFSQLDLGMVKYNLRLMTL